jgi:hypothetical protein
MEFLPWGLDLKWPIFSDFSLASRVRGASRQKEGSRGSLRGLRAGPASFLRPTSVVPLWLNVTQLNLTTLSMSPRHNNSHGFRNPWVKFLRAPFRIELRLGRGPIGRAPHC